MEPGLLLLGAGGHAHSCIDVVERDGRFRIVGLVGLPEDRGNSHLGYSVLGADDDLAQLSGLHRHALVTLGQIRSPEARIRLFEQATGLGMDFPVIVSPTAVVSRHATIGAGTIVMHGAIVNAGARVGRNCIINSRTLVEHDATIADHCHLSTGAIVNGDVRIGEGSFVGSGSTIKQGVVIGKRCVIGMAISVRHNQSDHTRYVGREQG